MPLRYVDPNKKHGPLYRANVWFGRTSAGRFLGRHFSPRVDPWVSRLTDGRGFGAIVSAPLIATGAKSGQPRQVQLSYFHDGRDPILIASNRAEPKQPQWYFNLKAHAECQFGGEHFVAAEVTDPAEYTRLFALAEQVFAGYGDYRAKTASVGRQIPIFRLKPAPLPRAGRTLKRPLNRP
jgi:deazaflavin-dependent oxidoreductase (nitroreductase family)